jgi:hypothetical protein
MTIPRMLPTWPKFRSHLASSLGEAMRLYRIRRRDGFWEVLAGDMAIAAVEEREELIQLARKVAARNNGELYVCDEAGKLETSYFYTEGVESIQRFRSQRLRLVQD